MKKVVFNGDFLAFKTFAGVSRFAYELIGEIDGLAISDEYELLCPEYVQNVPVFQNIKIVKFGNEQIDKWKHTSLPRYIKKQKALLIDLTQAFPLQVRGITCVHDCIPELIDTAYMGLFNRYIKKPIKMLQRRLILHRSVHLLTISKYSRNDLKRIYNLCDERFEIIPCAWQHIRRIAYDNSVFDSNPALTEREFYFSLGSRVPHKNIEWIIAAARANPNALFVVSGENSYLSDFSEKKFPENIIFTGYISDGAVRSLMNKCKAFIHPAFYEGFGIPPLEALSEGAEIIVSNAACLPEVYGKSAHYIDPHDYIHVNLEEILKTPVEPAQHTLERYSWKGSAIKLNAVIRKVTESM